MIPTRRESQGRKFGEFTVDLRAGELYHRGKKVPVQQQPMQLLAALLEKPTEILTREELRKRIWPADTFVDFEHGLNTAIKKLRHALRDRAKRSKFIETLPRRGYRFVAVVEEIEEVEPIRAGRGKRLEGKLFDLVAEGELPCVLVPVDRKAFDEWQQLVSLGDDVGVSMMITGARLLLLEAGTTVRVLSTEVRRGWCEVRVQEGEHYGKTAWISRRSLQAHDEEQC